MSKKTLNRANLERLGPERLAALVMDLVQGNAALQRRARMELSAAQGPKEVAADLRKRFASLRRATSFVDWRQQKALVKDLRGLLSMIETTVAPHDPDEAFDLLWSFLLLAPSIHERTDDSNGAVGDVLRDAVDVIEELTPRITIDSVTLAERVLDAIAEAGYGEFDGIIPATAEALGDDGLEHLKRITDVWQAASPSEEALELYRGFGLRASPEESIRRNKELTASVILADIADAQGDVDAYMARYSAEQLTYGTIDPMSHAARWTWAGWKKRMTSSPAHAPPKGVNRSGCSAMISTRSTRRASHSWTGPTISRHISGPPSRRRSAPALCGNIWNCYRISRTWRPRNRPWPTPSPIHIPALR